MSQKGGIAFSIKKKPSLKDRKPVAFHPENEKEEKHAVTSLSANTLKNLHAPKQEDVVIPLIKHTWGDEQNGRKSPGLPGDEKDTTEGKLDNKENTQPDKPKTIEEEAIDSLLNKKVSKSDTTSIPLLVANAVPGIDDYDNEDDKFRHDVSLRPDEPDNDAYDRVPPDVFGKAMLRGMGWKPGAPIGLTNKAVVEPIEFIARGDRLGLGALEKPKELKPKKYIKPGESRDSNEKLRVAPDADGRVRHHRKLSERLIPVHSLRLREGALVEFTEGPHRRLYARIKELGEKKSTLRLQLNEELVTELNDNFQVLDEHALPNDHPALRTKSKSNKQSRKDDPSRKSEKRKQRDSDSHRDRERSKRAKKRKPPKPVTWVQVGLRVRVVSESVSNGKHYSKKGLIVDIVDAYTFTLHMDSGPIVEGVYERHVETALPKAGGRVMIVRGQNKRRTGKLLERSSAKGVCVVQLDGDLEVVTLSFDDVSEFAGHN